MTFVNDKALNLNVLRAFSFLCRIINKMFFYIISCRNEPNGHLSEDIPPLTSFVCFFVSTIVLVFNFSILEITFFMMIILKILCEKGCCFNCLMIIIPQDS